MVVGQIDVQSLVWTAREHVILGPILKNKLIVTLLRKCTRTLTFENWCLGPFHGFCPLDALYRVAEECFSVKEVLVLKYRPTIEA